MWDIKKKGEQHSLYETCNRMCEVVKQFGFSLDGGKDSLSMSTKIENETISSPNQLVLSGYVDAMTLQKGYASTKMAWKHVNFYRFSLRKNANGWKFLCSRPKPDWR